MSDAKETDAQMLARLGVDGYKWNEEFQYLFPSAFGGAPDASTTLGWFCNAIEAGIREGESRGAQRAREEIWENVMSLRPLGSAPVGVGFDHIALVALKRIIFGEEK